MSFPIIVIMVTVLALFGWSVVKFLGQKKESPVSRRLREKREHYEEALAVAETEDEIRRLQAKIDALDAGQHVEDEDDEKENQS